MDTLDLFAYGTLKQGEANHAHFCQGVMRIEEAATRGRLFDLPAGYPALSVPPETILALGSGDLRADLMLQREWAERLTELSESAAHGADSGGAQGWVHGEWLTLPDAERRLCLLDRLEGFRPGHSSLYLRALVHCYTGPTHTSRALWTYIQTHPRGTFLKKGRWPG